MNKNAEYNFIGQCDEGRILEASRNIVYKNLNCHRIGKIVAFNRNTLTCDVNILDKMTYFGKAESYITVSDLPLLIQGTDSKHITFGDIVGSECIVHFNDVDIDNWFETGENYIPSSCRKHHFSDGFVELRPFNKNAVFSYYSTGLEIKNGNTYIHLNDDGTIEISNGNAKINMNGDTIAITGNVTATGDVTAGTISLKNHKHSGVSSGSSNTGTPI